MEAVRKEEDGRGRRRGRVAKSRERAGRNIKGYNKILEAIESRRTPYEQSNYLQNWEDIETPESLPSFYDFATKRQADKFYKEVDPTWGYTKTTELPLGFAFQRWRGAQTSKDKQNYRVPYWVNRPENKPLWTDYPLYKIFGYNPPRDLSKPYEDFKYGHRLAKTENTNIDKAKQFAGNFLPFLNTLLAGKATVGGTGIDEAAIIGGWGQYAKYLQDKDNRIAEIEREMTYNRDNYTQQQRIDLHRERADLVKSIAKNSIPYWLTQLAAGWNVGGMNANLTQEGLVIPTPALMRNPYNRGVRNVNEYYDRLQENASQSSRENVVKRDERELERLLDEYEREYGFRPVAPPRETPPQTVPVTRTTGNRGSNRNPIFLKNGGKVPFMTAKRK